MDNKRAAMMMNFHGKEWFYKCPNMLRTHDEGVNASGKKRLNILLE